MTKLSILQTDNGKEGCSHAEHFPGDNRRECSIVLHHKVAGSPKIIDNTLTCHESCASTEI